MTGVIFVYTMFKEYFTHQTHKTEKWVKSSKYNDETTTGRWPNEFSRRGLFNTRRIKQSLFDGYVYTANVALMVG